MGYFTSFHESSALPPYEELVDPEPSPQETISADGFEATRVFQVAWVNRIAFVNTMLGYASGKTLYFPCRYPSNNLAIAMSAQVKGAGQASGIPLEWQYARITMNYKVPEYETRTGQSREPFILETLEGAAEFITVPADGLFWDEAKTEALKDAEAPGMLRKLKTWNYTMLRLPEIPKQVNSLIGKINTKSCYSCAYDQLFEPGTLLMGTPIIKAGMSVAGQPSWDVTLSATWNESGWNLFLRKGGKLPQPIYSEYEVKVGGEIRLVTGKYSVYGESRFQPLLKETA